MPFVYSETYLREREERGRPRPCVSAQGIPDRLVRPVCEGTVYRAGGRGILQSQNGP